MLPFPSVFSQSFVCISYIPYASGFNSRFHAAAVQKMMKTEVAYVSMCIDTPNCQDLTPSSDVRTVNKFYRK
jgi:hypothetical protein